MDKFPKYVMTLAYGKPLYLKMAFNLARSFLLHNVSDIQFIIVTNSSAHVPEDVRSRIKILDMSRLEFQNITEGFLPKIWLDILVNNTPGDYLFIDSDCIIYGDLEPIFTRFNGLDFTAIGRNYSQGEWFGDIEKRCRYLDVQSLPVFVGAIYYFIIRDTSSIVFETARQYSNDYDSLEIVRLRNHKNEEPLISMGMALNNIPAFKDIKNTIKIDAMFCDLDKSISNVLVGKIHAKRNSIISITSPSRDIYKSPLILHFNDSYAQHYIYQKETLAMTLFFRYKFDKTASFVIAWILSFVPHLFWPRFKSILRPLYRVTFGTRVVTPSQRA